MYSNIYRLQIVFSECLRCLKPGGSMIFSVPFIMNEKKNTLRAYVDKNGDIVHVLEPEYHSDF